jgi:hypothetical protein
VFVFASQTVCGFRISPSIYQFKERPQNPLVPVIFKDHKSLLHGYFLRSLHVALRRPETMKSAVRSSRPKAGLRTIF